MRRQVREAVPLEAQLAEAGERAEEGLGEAVQQVVREVQAPQHRQRLRHRRHRPERRAADGEGREGGELLLEAREGEGLRLVRLRPIQGQPRHPRQRAPRQQQLLGHHPPQLQRPAVLGGAHLPAEELRVREPAGEDVGRGEAGGHGVVRVVELRQRRHVPQLRRQRLQPVARHGQPGEGGEGPDGGGEGLELVVAQAEVRQARDVSRRLRHPPQLPAVERQRPRAPRLVEEPEEAQRGPHAARQHLRRRREQPGRLDLHEQAVVRDQAQARRQRRDAVPKGAEAGEAAGVAEALREGLELVRLHVEQR